MKKLLSVLLTLALAVALCSFAGCGDEENTVVNPVSSDDSRIVSDSDSDAESIEYPPNALLAKSVSYDNDSESTVWEYTYEFDEKGNLTKTFKNGTLFEEYVIEENGDETKICYGREGSVNSKEKYYFDENKKVVRIDTYDTDTIEEYAEYSYDDAGNLLRENYYKEDESGRYLNRYFDYRYDENGLLEGKASYYCNSEEGDEWIQSESYSYDENGFLIERRRHGYEGADEIEEYTYDESGNRISVRGTEIYGGWDYTYDANGNMLTETHYTSSGEVSYWYEYTYLDQSTPENVQ